METNCKVSVMPKAEYAPLTNGDLKTNADESFLPIVLVSEGKIIKENIELANISQGVIEDIINKNSKGASVKDVLLLTLDRTGEGYLQLKKGEGKTITAKKVVGV